MLLALKNQQVYMFCVFVPLRFLAEHLGEVVVWDESTKTVTVGELFTHNIGTSTVRMLDDDTIKDINVPSYISKGNAMVSIRLFADAMHYRVYWYDEHEKVYMYTASSKKNIQMGELIENNKLKGFERIGFGQSRYYSKQDTDFDKKNNALMAVVIYENYERITAPYETFDRHLSGKLNEIIKENWNYQRLIEELTIKEMEEFYESKPDLYLDMFTSEPIDGNKINVYFIMPEGSAHYYVVELDENNHAISIN
jgi:hypothetical protein